MRTPLFPMEGYIIIYIILIWKNLKRGRKLKIKFLDFFLKLSIGNEGGV